MLTKVLIVFFIFLILYQILLANGSVVEGLENASSGDSSSSSSCSSSILAYKNSAAIQILQEQVNKLLGLDKEVQDISGNVTALNQQVAALVNQQAHAATQLVGNKPLTTTGLSSAP
jgi:methyl-accepting chemotaxis protein